MAVHIAREVSVSRSGSARAGPPFSVRCDVTRRSSVVGGSRAAAPARRGLYVKHILKHLEITRAILAVVVDTRCCIARVYGSTRRTWDDAR